jgi:hypothetical protein
LQLSVAAIPGGGATAAAALQALPAEASAVLAKLQPSMGGSGISDFGSRVKAGLLIFAGRAAFVQSTSGMINKYPKLASGDPHFRQFASCFHDLQPTRRVLVEYCTTTVLSTADQRSHPDVVVYSAGSQSNRKGVDGSLSNQQALSCRCKRRAGTSPTSYLCQLWVVSRTGGNSRLILADQRHDGEGSHLQSRTITEVSQAIVVSRSGGEAGNAIVLASAAATVQPS